MPTLWRVQCQEDRFPGMWQLWFKNQCVAVGWPSPDGYTLEGSNSGESGWSRARNAIRAVEIGDYVVAAMRDCRVCRLGQVTGKTIADDEWNPIVPPGPGMTSGEMGRRILVRWELTTGPDDRDLVIELPSDVRERLGGYRGTIVRCERMPIAELRAHMNDQAKWVGLTSFAYESALSDFIAAYPHRLEDGLTPYPNNKMRERVFGDGSRLDVLLMDRTEKPVIVECKQNSPSTDDVNQLRHYMHKLMEESGKSARGILVHGGARVLRADGRAAASSSPPVEFIRYRLDVDFASST